MRDPGRDRRGSVSRFLLLLVAIISCTVTPSSADSFTFTGTATFGNDLINFFISGPSFRLHSASPGGPASLLFSCNQGSLCSVPDQFIQTTDSFLSAPGDFSGGSVRGITAVTLTGGLQFSSSLFTAGSNPGNFGSGPVTFTGEITGFAFLPSGCESNGTCTSVGPEVFHLLLSGEGVVTASGEQIGQGVDGIFQVTYSFHGTATGGVTAVPEPSSLLLLTSGLAGLAVITRRRVQR